jgi:hypothetical protein
VQPTGSQRFFVAGRSPALLSDSTLALAATVVQVHELFRSSEIADDVEFADGFFFRNFERRVRGREIFAVAHVFGPLAVIVQEFKALRVFDEDVHEQGFTTFPGNTTNIALNREMN